MRGVGEVLSEFLANLKYSDIPADVAEYAKMLTLKTIASMVIGSTTRQSRTMTRIIKGRKLPGEVGVITKRFKTAAWEGTFLNSFFAHASELEDDIPADGVSWDITVIPAALMAAQKFGISGKDLLVSIVGGLEVHTRTAMFPTQHIGLGIVPPAIGPAAAVAKAINLSAEQIRYAFGLSLSGNAGTDVNFGFDTHFFESSMQAMHGFMAAEAAKENLTGNPAIEKYLINLLGKDYVKPEAMVDGLGARWRLKQIWIKKYPFAFPTHRHIDALLELIKENGIKYNDVTEVEVHVTVPEAERFSRPNPISEIDMQYSFEHPLAAALVYGDVNFDHVGRDALYNPLLAQARSRIKVIPHPEWPAKDFGGPARVVVKTKDGRTLIRERMVAIGSPQEPLTLEQLKGLFVKYTSGVLKDSQITSITDMILNMEKLPDVEELMNILTYLP